MVETYLQSKWDSIPIPCPDKTMISNTIENSFLRLSMTILESYRRFRKGKSSQRLRKQTKEASPAPEEDKKPVRPNLQSRKRRKSYFEQEKQKNEEALSQIRKWKQKPKNCSLIIQRLLEEERNDKIRQREESLVRTREMQQVKLDKMKSARARQYSPPKPGSNSKGNLSFTKQKPLFKIIEERYKKNVEIPALEERKEKLAKIRNLSESITKEELDEHQRWHKIQVAQRRKLSLQRFDSFFTQKGFDLFQKEKEEMEASKSSYIKKQEQFEKRYAYADTVKKLFAPEVDQVKAKELELRLHKLKNPVIKKLFSREKSEEWKPRKYPKNPMVPEPVSIHKEFVVADYLEEFKQSRKKKPQTELEAAEELCKHAETIESASIGQKNNKKINDLFLKSAKVKMQLLDNILKDNQ